MVLQTDLLRVTDEANQYRMQLDLYSQKLYISQEIQATVQQADAEIQTEIEIKIAIETKSASISI